MMDFNGYTGNILNVDLTNNKISFSKEKIEDLKKFIGGSGMNTMLGAERLIPNIDPIDIPMNLKIVSHKDRLTILAVRCE